MIADHSCFGTLVFEGGQGETGEKDVKGERHTVWNTALLILPKNKDITFSLIDRSLPKKTVSEITLENKIDILNNFRMRLSHSENDEFIEAKEQVKKIASIRLNDIKK